MPKVRRKPSHPPDIIRAIAARIPEKQAPPPPILPVEYVETPAQMAGTTVRVITTERGSRMKRRDRKHVLDILSASRVITRRQADAGLVLHSAWCATQLSPPSIREIFVDTSTRPDDIAVAQVDAMQRFADLMGHVPRTYRQAARRVCCDRWLPQSQREIADLRSGLNVLAKVLGL